MNIILIASLAWFGATCTFARSINVEDAGLVEFINIMDADGDEAVSLQEVRDKAREIAGEIPKEMGRPEMSVADMAREAVNKIDQQVRMVTQIKLQLEPLIG